MSENREAIRVIWKLLILPVVYLFFMWLFVVAAATLFFGDLLRAAGFVSAITLYLMTQSEFNKEFFGKRVPDRMIVNDAVQKQTQGK